MAQSTFLIIILGMVIAGIAVTLGIEGYVQNRKKARLDFLVGDTQEVATDAQRWMKKPSFFGGGGDSCAHGNCDWRDASLPAFGYDDDGDGSYHTHFGLIEIDGQSDPASLTITGTSHESEDQVVIRVTGSHPDSVHTELIYEYGQ